MVALLLPGCDELGLTTQTRAPRLVQNEIHLPAGYVLVEERFEDNSQAVPIRRYSAPAGPHLRASAIQMPPGFSRRPSLEAELAQAERFSGPWDLIGYWEGPAPAGDGTCNVIVSFSGQTQRLAEVEVACVLK